MKMKNILFIILLTSTICSTAYSQNFYFIDLVHDKNIPVERYSFDMYQNSNWIESQLRLGSSGDVGIYPNPVTNYLINSNGVELSIYDSAGRLVKKTSDARIEVSHWASGYYLVHSREKKLLILKK